MRRYLFLIALALAPFAAFGHEGHHVTNSQYRVPEGDNVMRPKAPGEIRGSGWGTYLYGMNRMDAALAIINCCRYGGDGDCQIVPIEGVKVVAGGYEWEGEFIPEAEATASPDDNFYACRHKGAGRSHCFFAPPQGF